MTPHAAPIRSAFCPGFTLIELLVAIAIIAFWRRSPYPATAPYMMRSRILDAVAKLSDHHTRMEQYFLDRRTYVDDVGNCGIARRRVRIR